MRGPVSECSIMTKDFSYLEVIPFYGCFLMPADLLEICTQSIAAQVSMRVEKI